jgi:hypothetical protein
MDRRIDTLEATLEGLTASERRVLGQWLARVLINLPDSEMAKHRICRLCAVRVCSSCPIPGHAI